MNTHAVFVSYWTGGTIESDCEVTPSGFIINIQDVNPPIPSDLVFTRPDIIRITDSGLEFPVIKNRERRLVIDAYVSPCGTAQFQPKEIRLDSFGIVVSLTGDGGGAIASSLKEGDLAYDATVDGIESMILAHAIAGIDITSPGYLQGIETAVIGAANAA